MPGIMALVDSLGQLLGTSKNPISDAMDLVNGGAPGANSYDALRSLNGLGYGTAGISSGGAAASTSIVLASVAGLQAGAPLRLSGGGGSEVVYVDPAYVAGNTTVPLQSAIVTGTRLSAEWPMFAASGPGLNQVLPFGVHGVAELILDTTGGANGQAVYRVKRGIVETTVVASGSRSTTQTVTVTNINADFLHVILDVTVVGTATVTVTINGVDPTSGKAYPLLVGAGVTTNSTTVYRVGPGLLAVANLVANDMVPKTMQVVVTTTSAATYSVGAVMGGV